jgi:hypothetical protein
MRGRQSFQNLIIDFKYKFMQQTWITREQIYFLIILHLLENRQRQQCFTYGIFSSRPGCISTDVKYVRPLWWVSIIALFVAISRRSLPHLLCMTSTSLSLCLVRSVIPNLIWNSKELQNVLSEVLPTWTRIGIIVRHTEIVRFWWLRISGQVWK